MKSVKNNFVYKLIPALFIVSAFLVFNYAYADVPLWEKIWGDSSSNILYNIVTDSSGNSYVSDFWGNVFKHNAANSGNAPIRSKTISMRLDRLYLNTSQTNLYLVNNSAGCGEFDVWDTANTFIRAAALLDIAGGCGIPVG